MAYVEVGWSIQRERFKDPDGDLLRDPAGKLVLGDQKYELQVRRYPWWVELIKRSHHVLCQISRHRYCHTAAFAQVEIFLDKHAKKFEVSMSYDQLDEFCKFMQWDTPNWVNRSER